MTFPSYQRSTASATRAILTGFRTRFSERRERRHMMLMNPDSMIKLIGSGTTRGVEDQWMTLVEGEDAGIERLRDYAPVLSELKRGGHQEQAAALAWTAIESCLVKFSPEETLTLAGPFLLAVGNGQELRGQVTELYRSVYSDLEGLEGLLTEAGLPAGRPVRRALRTLDVCVSIKTGDYLLAREGSQAARVDGVDRDNWQITITSQGGQETRGPVELADEYRPVDSDSFFVLKQFHRDDLKEQLEKDPATLIVSLCESRGGSMDRDTLQRLLVPDCMDAGEWKRWWTKARTAMKKVRGLQADRRAPYAISYDSSDLSLEELHLSELGKIRDPFHRLAAIETYSKECTAQGAAPDADALRRCAEYLAEEADAEQQRGGKRAPLCWVIVRRVGQLAQDDAFVSQAVTCFEVAPDLESTFAALYDHEDLHEIACELLRAARPDTWKQDMLSLLPGFSVSACDREAGILLDSGCDASDLDAVIEKALGAPLDCFHVLAWRWNGPSHQALPDRPLVTLLSRILRAMHEVRRADHLSKEAVKRVVQRARQVLASRKHERYRQCLETIDAPMANALRTQLLRLDNLGRAVRDEMLRLLNEKFPPPDNKPKLAPWQLEDTLFVTRAGFLRKQNDIDHHVNVTMRENAIAIGAAAERGDLSENSEYKFALEERDLLRARLAQMNSEMAMAKIIDEDSIPVDHVGIGTSVSLKKEDSEEILCLTFIGPWDTDPDAGRYNYQAPMAQKVLGAHIGDEIELELGGQRTKYEVVQLANGLAEPQETPSGSSTPI